MTALLAPYVGIVTFSNGPYLLLLALAVIVYFALPGVRTRAGWLLAVSAAFYLLLAPQALALVLAVCLVSFVTGVLLERVEDEKRRTHLVAASLVLLVGHLVAYKILAAGVLGVAGGTLTGATGTTLRIALPLGISFWTFQAIAYVVDVYRRVTPAEKNPLYYLLAVLFFPVVTSGPITRVQALVEQLRTRHRFDYDSMNSGLLLIGRGFFKKLMIADRLAVFVSTVFDHPRAFGWDRGSVLLVAAIFFSIQLYCDFSGYTDIVRGSARLFGVELPLNFRAPYFARSVREFWRRWHITLMDWFKEYVYIPLGGNRVGRARRYANLLAVFALSGLWHGEGVTYLIWGLLNGGYQIGGQLLAPVNERAVKLLRLDRAPRLHALVQTALTFGLITIAWVFFRAASVGDAVYVIAHMVVPSPAVFADGTLLAQGLNSAEMLIVVLASACLFGAEWLTLRADVLSSLRARPMIARWAIYYALIMAIVIFGAYGGTYNAADFVYFRY